MALTNAERQRAYRERKAKGISIREGRVPLTSAERAARYRQRHPDHYRSWRLDIKRDILTHYGNGRCACVRCGESRLACLSIDHIAGGGNKQRQGKLRGTVPFYLWLRSNDYPEGYQTLCMNCQFIKRFERGEHN